MAVYARLEAALVVSTDADREEIVLSRSTTQVVSTLERAANQVVEIAAGENRQINLGSMTEPVLLWIEAPAAVSVRTDASDGSAQVVAPILTGSPGLLVKTGAITGLWVENEGAAAVVITVGVAGME